MDYTEIEALREQHPAWRLLRAQHAPLVLAFLGEHFVEQNSGATPASQLVDGLDDQLYALNSAYGPNSEDEPGTDDADAPEPRFPRSATEYLDQWSDPESGWLRRFYPLSSDEIHYDATPALEKLAYTILAASLAYQFGLSWGVEKARDFRFAVIDEAFGRGSDVSTRYALDLFAKLRLQLLIVTPLQKVHVIEPYVQGIGFVDNPDGHESRLHNLTIEEYRAQNQYGSAG